ncbi:hypothetical protein H0264_06460 [Nocardia huaxiensis]|uniref:Uncharacterized protein n=1 Tax=Nocardia huaxiensis TaxID=2755382 RepID=A0A7D6ZIQ4_9NOCA|nr:hypothetical protein [Nocardia huaxiensis]QLY31939.1 hypothetical protein H0264_06460 [Nocardia huaxiensis]
MPVPVVNSVLAETAFGATPATAAAGLPAATSAPESWLRAVALAGVGHYAAGRAELRRAGRATTDPVLRSFIFSTEGSLLRQLGWHAHAAVADGRAAALVLPPDSVPADPLAPPEEERARARAVCDALTGLAADALGTARPALSARLLTRCRTHFDTLLSEDSSGWRQRIRLHWVSAETALSAPGAGLIAPPAHPAAEQSPEPPLRDPALAHAEAALALAEQSPSVRHQVKSRLLVAAAAAATGDLDRSRILAAEVADQCREHELLPLRWACAMLRSGVDPASGGAAEAAECAGLLAARGGRLRSVTDTLGTP